MKKGKFFSKRKATLEVAQENHVEIDPSTEEKEDFNDDLTTYDPIMMVPIGPDEPTYIFTRPNGTKLTFCLPTLVEYLTISRRFVDPSSQIEFTDANLLEMEDACERQGMVRPNLLGMKNDEATNNEHKMKLDVLYGVDRLMGDRVSDMLDIILGTEPRATVERSLHRLFDTVSRDYQQLCFDPTNFEFAIQCRRHYIEFLRGPPNDPTPDREGLLTKCIDFLEGLAILTMIYD